MARSRCSRCCATAPARRSAAPRSSVCGARSPRSSRAELRLLFPLLVIPMWHWRTKAGEPHGRAPVLALGAVGVVVIGPWVGYNLSRFDDPVYISTGLGASMGGGACDPAFSGPKLGYWDASPGCGAQQAQITLPPNIDPATAAGHAALERAGAARELAHEGDESVRDTAARDAGRRLPQGAQAAASRSWSPRASAGCGASSGPWQTATFDGTDRGPRVRRRPAPR